MQPVKARRAEPKIPYSAIPAPAPTVPMSEASPIAAPAPKASKAAASSSAAVTVTPPSYEAGLRELEQLLADMESGQLPLDQLLQSYQRGAELLTFCRSRLEAVETQVKVLEDGVLKPWNPQS